MSTKRVGLKIAVKDEPNFFFEKEDFLKNGYGYDFETFTNEFLAKKLYQNQLSPKTKFLFPKHEFGYGVSSIGYFAKLWNDHFQLLFSSVNILVPLIQLWNWSLQNDNLLRLASGHTTLKFYQILTKC